MLIGLACVISGVLSLICITVFPGSEPNKFSSLLARNSGGHGGMGDPTTETDNYIHQYAEGFLQRRATQTYQFFATRIKTNIRTGSGDQARWHAENDGGANHHRH